MRSEEHATSGKKEQLGADSSGSAASPAPPAPNEPATDLQVLKIRELAKSSNPTVQLLKAAYQKEHGIDPAGGDDNARWSKLAAVKFIDEACELLKGKKKE